MIELPWDGRPLGGEWLAFDTETTIVDLSKEIPELVVLTAYDGRRNVLVFSRQLDLFLWEHRGRHWVGWNTAFDWWACRQAVSRLGGRAEEEWLRAADENRLHDGMILEQLVRLGEGRDNGGLWNIGLAAAAKEYLGETVEKDEQVRLTFTPDMAVRWDDPDLRPHWEYAAKDAVVTYRLWEALEKRARSVQSSIPVGVSPPDGSAEKFGLLTEAIQVKASLALAQIARNGFAVDREKIDRAIREHTETADRAIRQLEAACPGLLKRYKRTGELKKTAKGMPQVNQDVMRAKLADLAASHGVEAPTSERSRKLTLKLDYWMDAFPDAPVVKEWTEYMDSAKTLSLLKASAGVDRVHPRYSTLVRTGRTSATGPNIQQIPREGWFRSLFQAGPGRLLATVDYSAIELRTLAAVCEFRYGKSVLADVIRAGRDPHTFTAALVLKRPYEEVAAGVAAKDKAMKAARQSAKAINFGVPGGLGAAKLRGYAKKSYGVDMTADEAARLRQTLVTEVYPELTLWLEDSLRTRLRDTLGCPVKQVDRVFGKQEVKFIPPEDSPEMLLVGGYETKRDGKVFSPYFHESVWVGLEHLLQKNTPADVARAIRDQEPSMKLFQRLTWVPSVTLTGRVRGKVFYYDYRNTHFQGLAADGAKLALWELTRLGYRVVAFVHDEIVCEVEEAGANDALRRIQSVMSSAFRAVLPVDLPIDTEGVVGPVWAKG